LTDQGGDFVRAGGEAVGDAGAELGPLDGWCGGPARERRLAAATALSTSSGVPSGMVPMTSSVVELVTGSVPVSALGTQAPST